MDEDRKRTKDVIIDEQIDFSQLHISSEIIKGLTDAGYKIPSPIQLKAIPLGKSGTDLIAQSKSGTGKTVVFSVVSLEKVIISELVPQVIILSPTREIAQQSQHVIRKIGKHIFGLRCETFIGGVPIARDIDRLSPCHIVVGTPGRVKQLIEEGWLRVDTIKLFILDEVDKLMGESSLHDTTKWILETLSEQKQFMAFSATYTDKIMEILQSHMKDPQFIMLDKDRPSLEGVKQFYWCLESISNSAMASIQKSKKVIDILSKLSFHQCLIFCNNRGIARSLSSTLNRNGWPSMVISSSLSQKERNQVIKKLRTFNIRVLISSDLTSRGVDIDRVNLVINMDLPREKESYMHRIGRTGRFGTYGIAITFVNDEDLKTLKSIVEHYQSDIEPLPDDIPEEFYAYELKNEQDKKSLEKLEKIRKEANERVEEVEEEEEEEEINQEDQNDWSNYNYYYPGYYGHQYNYMYYQPSDMNQNYISTLQTSYIPEISRYIESYIKINKKKRKRG